MAIQKTPIFPVPKLCVSCPTCEAPIEVTKVNPKGTNQVRCLKCRDLFHMTVVPPQGSDPASMQVARIAGA